MIFAELFSGILEVLLFRFWNKKKKLLSAKKENELSSAFDLGDSLRQENLEKAKIIYKKQVEHLTEKFLSVLPEEIASSISNNKSKVDFCLKCYNELSIPDRTLYELFFDPHQLSNALKDKAKTWGLKSDISLSFYREEIWFEINLKWLKKNMHKLNLPKMDKKISPYRD